MRLQAMSTTNEEVLYSYSVINTQTSQNIFHKGIIAPFQR